MIRVYEEIIDFIAAGTTPNTIVALQSSADAKARVADLIHREQTVSLSAEEAALFHTAIFSKSKIVQITRYEEAGREVHGKAPGTVPTVAFELEGQAFTALNGGPILTFNEAISFQVMCETQEEVYYYLAKAV